jgi:RHS repeat-associated protein
MAANRKDSWLLLALLSCAASHALASVPGPDNTLQPMTTRDRAARMRANQPKITLGEIKPFDSRTSRAPFLLSRERGPSPVTEYPYDVLGNLARVCADASTGGCTQLRLFTYDGRGFLLSERTPERGVNGNATTEYSLYDSRGNAGRKLTGAVDGPFDLRTAYDSLGRPLSLSSHGGTRVVKEWLYDVHPNGYSRSGAMVRSIRRNNDGAFAGDFVVSEHVQYEGGAGRISRIDTDIAHATAGSRSLFQTWRWTDLGNADEQLYPFFSGMPLLETKNDYTGGVLTRVRNKSGGDYASSIRYHANGLTHEVGHANGMTETIAADSSGMARPKSISFSGASAWSSGDYSYDGAGNVTAIGNTRYAYDSANRLRGWYETFTGGHASHYLGYDLFGNKYDLGFERCGSDPGSGMMHCMQTSVAVPVINAATNHFAGMSHDADGNFIANGTYSYQYDGTSMMTGMSTGSRDFRYVYTADDERIGTYDVSAQTWVWKLRDIGGKPLREFTSSGGTLGFANWSWAKDYVYRGNTILASITPSETQHFHPDHLGTPRLITGASGVQRGRHDYYPFGAESTSSLQNNQLLKFTAHERDLNGPAGSEDRDYLDYMHARFYNPNLGRFLSVDPSMDFKANLFSPQRWNRYAYVSNNPLTKIDPDGRDEYAMEQRLTGIEDDWRGRDKYQAAALGGIGVLAGAAAMLPGIVGGGIARGAFRLAPITRGWAIEAALAAKFGGGLPSNFPTIDRFLNGVATSVKSLDLFSKTYQNAGRLTSTLNGFVDKLAQFNGARLGNANVPGAAITQRVLEVIVQKGAANPAQMAAIRKAAVYAKEHDVTLKVIMVK